MNFLQQWFQRLFSKQSDTQEVYVLFNQVTNRFLTFDPVTEKFSEVSQLKELKIWDWQYSEIAAIAWEKVLTLQAIIMKKLSDKEARKLCSGKRSKNA